jgi:hypothetical protein
MQIFNLFLVTPAIELRSLEIGWFVVVIINVVGWAYVISFLFIDLRKRDIRVAAKRENDAFVKQGWNKR